MNTNTKPLQGDEPKKDNNSGDEQGRPVEVNMAAPEKAREGQPSPVLDDEEVDHKSENDFRYNTQKTGSDDSSRRI